MAKQYEHKIGEDGKPKVVEVPRVRRGINPEVSEGTVKDGPVSRLVDGLLNRMGK